MGWRIFVTIIARSNPEQELIWREQTTRVSLRIMLKQVLMTGLEAPPNASLTVKK
jgi:hypothetical protein